jgi:hypothetical protein
VLTADSQRIAPTIGNEEDRAVFGEVAGAVQQVEPGLANRGALARGEVCEALEDLPLTSC